MWLLELVRLEFCCVCRDANASVHCALFHEAEDWYHVCILDKNIILIYKLTDGKMNFKDFFKNQSLALVLHHWVLSVLNTEIN